jgi:hypothetical protein
MSDESQIRWQALPPMLLVLLLAVGSYWWLPYALDVERPPQPYAGVPMEGVHQAEARLWEDPFAAVIRDQAHERGTQAATRGLSWLNNLADAKCRDSGGCKVLGVMVPGGPYTGLQESRRATRFAVLAALSREGLVPEDTEHVGWVEPGHADSEHGSLTSKKERSRLPPVLPFEWLSVYPPTDETKTSRGATGDDGGSPTLRQAPAVAAPPADRHRPSRVLLLWLDEDALTGEYFSDKADGSAKPDREMLPRLAKLLRHFTSKSDIYDLQIIGPYSSGTLIQLADEWLELKAVAETAGTAARRTVGPTSSGTAPDAEMLPSEGQSIPGQAADQALPTANTPGRPNGEAGGDPTEQNIIDPPLEALRAVRWLAATPTSARAWQRAQQAVKNGLSITRVTATDNDLATALVDELRRRGLKAFDTVALVGQLDTAYSRDLIDLLKERLAVSVAHGNVQVVTAYYLRGIDGRKPSGNDENGDKQDRNDQRGGVSGDETVERPEGESQIDYLRRLTAEFARQHQAYKPAGQIRAVGILGDDYHDKLLILKALRHAFPDAVFFTTDLDASMLHPVDNRHTRNLVVATAFGLELEPALQAGVPPLRSGYKTAIYLAVRLAIDGDDDLSPAPARSAGTVDEYQQWLDRRIPSLVFEIGRTAPIRLNNPDPRGDALAGGCGPQHADVWMACPDWQPVRDNRPKPKIILGLVLAGIGALALAAYLHAPFRRFVLARRRILVAVALVTAALAGWLIASLPSPLGEPFSWFEGVSIWPSEILRLFTVVLSVALLLLGVDQLRRADDAVDTRFFRSLHLHETNQERAESPGQAGVDGGEGPPVPGTTAVPAPESGRGAAAVSVRDVWRLYRAHQFPVHDLTRRLYAGQADVAASWLTRHFLLRTLLPLMLYLSIGTGLVLALGSPQTPARGLGALVVDKVVLVASILSFLMLLLFTLDASRRGVWLVKNLAGKGAWPSAVWPADTLRRFGWREGCEHRYFDDFLDVQLIADVTDGLQRLVYSPFLVFFLLVLSRTPLFDGWHVPVALYLIFCVAALLMLVAALWVRRAAEEARRRALERMGLYLLEIQGRGDLKSMEQQMQSMIAMVRGTRRGAYVSLLEQPIVRALIGLASGIYAIAFVEWRSLGGF